MENTSYIIIAIALLQTFRVSLRKMYPFQNKINISTIIILESIIMNFILVIYFLKYNSLSRFYSDLNNITLTEYMILIINAFIIVFVIILLYEILPEVEFVKYGPMLSASQILLYGLVGLLILNEKITLNHVLAYIFMLVGAIILFQI